MPKSLFKQYPVLSAKLPSVDLANLPTPVGQFSASSVGVSQIKNLWIKHDDKTNATYGGNKVRKLEFILAEVKRLGKTKLVTFGATGTNHGVATSLFCQQQGLDCKVFLFDQPDSETVRNNFKLMQAFNAELLKKGSLFNTVLNFYRDKILNKDNAYYLFAGGSNTLGCIAFVNAAFELKQQVDEGLLPEPDQVMCPVSSAATIAGLTLGCALAGLKTKVVGVRVGPSHIGIIPACTTSTITKLMLDTYKQLIALDETIPKIEAPAIHLLDEYYGKGYGELTDAASDAQELFGQAGLKLDATYTAKAAAAVLDACKIEPDKNILYWHTLNSADMSEYLS